MKIAISSSGTGLDSKVYEFFGRAPNFIIATIKDGKLHDFISISNVVSDQTRGAGVSSAKLVADHGVEAVISENIGPRAMEVFTQFGIKAYRASGKVSSAINDFAEGRLEKI